MLLPPPSPPPRPSAHGASVRALLLLPACLLCAQWVTARDLVLDAVPERGGVTPGVEVRARTHARSTGGEFQLLRSPLCGLVHTFVPGHAARGCRRISNQVFFFCIRTPAPSEAHFSTPLPLHSSFGLHLRAHYTSVGTYMCIKKNIQAREQK
eukprot:1021495-Pleurochrysis_carterae.AAC.1